MMGFGAYGYGGPYLSSSSSSSLSALAPPFTVERPVAKPVSSPMVDNFTPLVEVTDPPYGAAPLQNWLHPLPPSSGSNFFANPTPAFDSVPSSNAYRYAGLPAADSFNTNLPSVNAVATPLSNAFTYDQGLDVVATSFVEVKPYYPSYLSPTIHGDSPMVPPDQPSYDWLSTSQFAPLDGSAHKEHTQRPSSSKYTAQWDGSWNGAAEWEQGKQGQFDGSFGPKETDVSAFPHKNYLNQDPQSSSSLKPYGVNDAASCNIPGWGGSVNAEHLGEKSYLGINSKFSPVDYTKPTMGSLSGVPDSPSKAPSLPFVAKSTYGVPCEKRQHTGRWNNAKSISKPSPASVIRPLAIGTKMTRISEPEMGLFKRLNSGKDAASADNGSSYRSLESHLPQEDRVPFESSQLTIHLGRNDPFSVDSLSAKDRVSNNQSINNDAFDHLFEVKPGHPSPHVNRDNFEACVHSFLNSSESVDPKNPAVDSPCWKGVPGSCFSPFKASEEGGQEQMMKLEGCDGLNPMMQPMIFSLNTVDNISTQKPVEYHELGCLGNGLPLPLKKSLEAKSYFGEHKLDDTMKTTCYLESSRDRGIQGYIGTPDSGIEDKSSSLYSNTVQGGHRESGSTAEAKNTIWSVNADAKLNINDTLECGSSNTSSAVVNISGSSIEDAASKLTESNGKERNMNLDVQMLINTMNSLSELLLVNCSNSSCQLKQKDLDTLKAVINNLNSCILKHDEDLLSMPESPPCQESTLKYIEELCKPNKVSSRDRPIEDPLHLPGVQRVKKHDSFVQNDDEVIHSVSAKSDLYLLKQEKMTEALKNILSENFHTEDTHPQTLLYKNLWLEAEAVVCSTNYMARFNRLKIEMEKCKADQSKDVFEHTADMMRQSRSEVWPISNPVDTLSPEVQGCPKSNLQQLPIVNQEDDDVMARFHVLRNRIENSNSTNATNGDDSSSSLSLVLDKVDEVAPEADTGLSIQDSSTSSLTGPTNDYEDSVMARFHIIRDRVEKSKFISDANVKDTVSSKVCHEHKADRVAPETSDDGFMQYEDSVSTSTSLVNQYEDSVLARFNIIKSRADNSGYIPTVGQHLENVDLGYAGKRNLGPITCNKSEDGSSDVKEQSVLSSADNNKGRCMSAKEFRLYVEDDPSHSDDGSIQEFDIQDYLIPAPPGHANQCEDSILARFNILKSRLDNSGNITTAGNLLGNVDPVYTGKRNRRPITCNRSEDGYSDVNEQPVLQSHIADDNEGKFVAAKEFCLFNEDDPCHMINRPANQLPAGCPDRSSSSDWEHVMKEDVMGHSC